MYREYRLRFSIETSDRLKNSCRIRSTTKTPVLHLLFMALAFVLVNVWISLLWRFVCRKVSGTRWIYRNLFPLKTMLEFLALAVERLFPSVVPFFCQSPSNLIDLLRLIKLRESAEIRLIKSTQIHENVIIGGTGLPSAGPDSPVAAVN